MKILLRLSVMPRLLVAWLALAAPALVQAQAAPADGYPVRPVHILVGGAPGAPSDVVDRVVAEPLAVELGQPVVIEDHPGAIGSIALARVARARPDGYTLGNFSMPGMIAPVLLPHVPYDLTRDFTPVRQLSWVSHVLVVRADSPITSLAQLIATARSHPGKLTYASGGTGTPAHLVVEFLKQRAGLYMVHVPFNGPMAGVTAVIGGHVDMMLAVAPSVVAQIHAGRLRALATTAPSRIAALPDVPTMAELGYSDLSVRDWHGIVAPAGTPAAVVARLADAIQKVLAQEPVRQHLTTLGMDPAFESDPERFARFARSEMERWSGLVRRAGIRGE